MPGSGKTYFGKRLHEQLGIPLFDLDVVIAEKEGKSVTEIFSQDGEEHFRKVETEYLKKLTAENTGCIISTGGGTPCFHGNMDYMNEVGITVFLYAGEELLIERISRNDKRPLMKDNVEEKVRALLSTRTPIYEKAHITMLDRDMDVFLEKIATFN